MGLLGRDRPGGVEQRDNEPASRAAAPGPSGASADPLIRISGLTKRYPTRAGDEVTALSGVDLAIHDGEFLTVVGPSGCGKTTLMRILAGLEGPSGGSVTIGGAPITGPRPDVAVVFQQATLLPWRTVLDNVLLPIDLQRRARAQCLDRAQALLRLVGLAEFAGKYPFELSGGMQQRVSICRALMRDPRILLMDEPFGALDAMTREAMNLELARIWAEQRKTVIFITHSIPEAVFLGDRVLVLSARPGRVSALLTVDIPRPRTIATLATERFAALSGEVRAVFDPTALAGAAL
jgi:NitT/TauT family transport system ATP-binding protein